jgi:hypothetical protein
LGLNPGAAVFAANIPCLPSAFVFAFMIFSDADLHCQKHCGRANCPTMFL